MKKYYKNKTCIVLLGIMLMIVPLWSCKKFVTLPLPSYAVPADAIYSDSSSLTAAVNGVYSDLAEGPASSAFEYPSLFADELISSSTSYGNDGPAQTNGYTPANDFGFFTAFYKTIYEANAILAGIDNAKNISDAPRNQIKGECLFLRSFAYFELVNFYGGVPLYTGINVNKNALLPASPAADVYQQIITDLTSAVPLLADDYVEQERTRANKQTANTLLARVYLYTKDYAKAITTASSVINSSLYTLNPDVNSVFVKTSEETIFQLWNQYGVTLGGRYIPDDPSNPFSYTVQQGLVASFEPGDTRKGAWLMAGTDAQSDSYYSYKWKATYSNGGPAEYLIEFRLAEMYLVRAEALAQTNDVAGGLADIYVIRNRAGLSAPLPGVTTSARLLDVVASERRKELCFEGGHRWFDLNRTGKTISVLSLLKPGIDAHVTLLPFPQSQIQNNPNLVQNPRYN